MILFKILPVRIRIDPHLKNPKKGNVLIKNHPREHGLKSGQPYEIFPSLFYLLDYTTLMKVIERCTYG